MSGKLDVSRVKKQPESNAMPDKQITLTLELPNGKTETMQFRRDLTVDYVKLQLQSRLGLPADKQELELAGRAMADPLSLSDFPSLLSSGRGVVRVLLSAGGEEEEEKEPPAADEAGRSLEDEELA